MSVFSCYDPARSGDTVRIRSGQGNALAEAEFSVTYDGSALTSGRMSVQELAPALIALSELFAEANRTLNPDAPPVQLEMVHGAERGSFIIHLALIQPDEWSTLVEWVNSDSFAALEKIWLYVVGPSAIGLLGFIKWLRGRRATRQEQTDQKVVTYVTDDGSRLTVPEETAALYDNITVRRRTRELVEPLYLEGVESVRISSETEEEFILTKDDLPAFEGVDAETPSITEQETEVVLEIVNVAFKPGNKWRFSFGAQTFYATMADADFEARVQRRDVAFAKGDLLRCRLRIDQRETEDGLSTYWTVVKVLRHTPTGGEPMRLPLREAPSAEGDAPPGLPPGDDDA